MTATTSYDYCVIGGGIIGLSTALTLLGAQPGATVVLLEKEDMVAAEQSAHAGVVELPLGLPAGSAAAKAVARGGRQLAEFCHDQGIPFRAVETYYVAASDADLPALAALSQQASLHGLAHQRLDRAELGRRQPGLRGVAALAVTGAGCVDIHQVCRAMAEQIQRRGGVIRTGAVVRGIQESAERVSLDVRTSYAPEVVLAQEVIVCAGLQADRMAGLAGVAVEGRVVPLRERRFRLPRRSAAITAHVRSASQAGGPGPGVDMAPDGGAATVGSTRRPSTSRDLPLPVQVSPRDMVASWGYPGFWKALGAHRPAGSSPLVTTKRDLIRGCSTWLPDLTLGDLSPAQAGTRAVAIRPDGTVVNDLILARTPRTLHVCAVPWAGATAALAIAAAISEAAQGTTQLDRAV